jgi:hypothetical protein
MKFKKFTLVTVLLLNLSFAFLLLSSRRSSVKSESYPELKFLEEHSNLSFKDLSSFFSNLSEEKGAVYAFEVLKLAKAPPNTDMHLLGHVVGDALYIEKGIEGIKYCTQDFRNACSHSVVVGELLKNGKESLENISVACKSAPGGKGAYTMCYHGLGHGVLAFTNYDLPQAFKMCEQLGTDEYQNQEASECAGGVIMEIISGGFHDLQKWTVARPKYLEPLKPLELCNKDYVFSHAKTICYTYITPFLFEAAGADISSPTEKDFAQAFQFCKSIHPDQANYRNTCFGAFGKEFVTLAQNRDIRRVDQMTSEQLSRVYSWCRLASDESGSRACVEHAIQSLYWGGENDYHASISMCNVIANTPAREECFNYLWSVVKNYSSDIKYKDEVCGSFPSEYAFVCQN